MVTMYRPLEAIQRSHIIAALAAPPASLDDLARTRAALTRVDAPLDAPLNALRALAAAEPGFEERLLRRVVPSIFGYARALLEKDEPSLPIHESGRAARTTIPRVDVAGWIALLIIGALPQPGPDHPDLDMTLMLSRTHSPELAKLRCILEYFDRIQASPPPGHIEIERVVAAPKTSDAWATDSSPLAPLAVDDAGSIEDAEAHRQVDFANRYLGGGVLSGGCVQEEIRFAIAPELIACMIVSPRMANEEAIVLRGAERFAKTKGYGRSLEYGGSFHDPAARSSALGGAPDVELAAIDALDFRRRDPKAQLTEEGMLRELTKARAGFLRDARGLPVATGNWGCGVFLGDPALKAVLQWMAASAEARSVLYCSFGDKRVGDLGGFAAAARERIRTVGALWIRLRGAVGDGGSGLYTRLLQG